jgi:hypothetical protein
MQPSPFKLIKGTPLLLTSPNYLSFKIIISPYSNQKIKIPLSASSFYCFATSTTVPILQLSEGQAGKAWEPSNKMMFFLP